MTTRWIHPALYDERGVVKIERLEQRVQLCGVARNAGDLGTAFRCR
jgi:hypothetical protein